MTDSVPTFVPNVTINMTKLCGLDGGTPDKNNPVLCHIPTSIVPDRASCYAGPNQAYWIPDRGCVDDMVVSCLAMNTFKKWYYQGDDVFCVTDFDQTECAPTTKQGGNRIGHPEVDAAAAERSATTKNIGIRQTQGTT